MYLKHIQPSFMFDKIGVKTVISDSNY